MRSHLWSKLVRPVGFSEVCPRIFFAVNDIDGASDVDRFLKQIDLRIVARTSEVSEIVYELPALKR